MTIIDELLILLDDLEEAPSDTIPSYFEKPDLQVIYSALGRLVNKGLVIKKERRGEISYSISLHGVEALNQTLDSVKQPIDENWNQRWHLIIFDIPESKRKLRDGFRNFLKDAGFGMLKSSVWVSPKNQSERIRRYAKRHKIEEYVFQMETIPNESTYQLHLFVRQCWDRKTIEKQYEAFIATGERTLNKIRLENRPYNRFFAKKAVFQYAETVKADPGLPESVAPHSRLVRRALELYTKLRPYCIQE